MSSTTNNTMDGDAVGFQDVFNQNTFTIPDFQRNFEWEKEDVGTFYTDICYAREKNQQYLHNQTKIALFLLVLRLPNVLKAI